MDTSETYIKMCEKAEEIQNHKPKAGDYYRNGNGDVVILPMEEHITGFCNYECLYLLGADDEVWLPRQGQLQEMVPNKHINDWQPEKYPLHLATVLKEFVDAMYDSWQDMSWQPESMEQLWLAFVMRDNNKVWDGEDWHGE